VGVLFKLTAGDQDPDLHQTFAQRVQIKLDRLIAVFVSVDVIHSACFLVSLNVKREGGPLVVNAVSIQLEVVCVLECL